MPPPENRLLAALPPADFARLTARMTDITFGHKDLLYRTGGPIEYVYFPRTGMQSTVVVMEDGTSAEVGVTGREGMIGAAAGIGAQVSKEDVYCQIYPSTCRRMSAEEFAAECRRGQPVRGLVYDYLRAALSISARQTACNCLHSLDERCARWLLQCHDAVGEDEFPLTHEFLSVMLGVRRATVSVAAAHLQTAGTISYHHGRVTVVDRARLEEAACECYRAIRRAFDPRSA